LAKNTCVKYYHYDSLERLIIDSAIFDKRGSTDYYHVVNGENKLKYTYYHKSGIILLSHIETENDDFVIDDRVKVINGDTIKESDTIFLYYPNLYTLNSSCNNITLDAFNEKRFSQMDTSENIVRIFKVEEVEDLKYPTIAIAYPLYITQDSLQITKKTGEQVCSPLRTSRLDRIKNYTYEEFNRKISPNKKIRYILQKMTALEYLPIDKFEDNLMVEYRINGKYYLMTFTYEDNVPYEVRKTYEVVKKLISYLESKIHYKNVKKVRTFGE
jgi:hypothetical protein